MAQVMAAAKPVPKAWFVTYIQTVAPTSFFGMTSQRIAASMQGVTLKYFQEDRCFEITHASSPGKKVVVFCENVSSAGFQEAE